MLICVVAGGWWGREGAAGLYRSSGVLGSRWTGVPVLRWGGDGGDPGEAEAAFLALGSGAHAWLVEAAAAGAQRVRSKMAAAVELAALVGVEQVDAALGVAATAGRFADGDLLAIVPHRATGAPSAALVVADEEHSAQPGTSAWAALGTRHCVDTSREEPS